MIGPRAPSRRYRPPLPDVPPQWPQADAETRAREAELGLPPLEERTFLVTGATDGIGRWTTQLLVSLGCKVLVHGRSDRKVLGTMRTILQDCPKAKMDGFQADFNKLSEVRELAAFISERHPVIHGILHNAATIDGSYSGKKVVTWDKFEDTMAVNAFAPFLLTSLLLENVKASGCGRIMFSGSANMAGGEYLDDLECERMWTGNHAYRLSKLCLAMMAEEMSARYGDAPRLCFHAFDPGTVDTKLMKQGASWGRGMRKARRKIPMVKGLLPNLRTTNASLLALTDNRFQEFTGGRLDGSPPEVADPVARQQLWDRLVERTKANWPKFLTASESSGEPAA